MDFLKYKQHRKDRKYSLRNSQSHPKPLYTILFVMPRALSLLLTFSLTILLLKKIILQESKWKRENSKKVSDFSNVLNERNKKDNKEK
jgi:hypothetical protein